MSENPTADHVTVEIAGKLAGISSRTLRHWIASGKLSAIAGKRGKLVSMGEVEQLARMVGKPVGNATSPSGNPATSAEEVAGNLAEPLADAALVSDLARQQLATIRDEWLAPLIERIGELERENGRLEATTAAKDETIAELRRRAERAEAERDRLTATQAAQDDLGATEASAAARGDAPGVWGRLARWWRGA